MSTRLVFTLALVIACCSVQAASIAEYLPTSGVIHGDVHIIGYPEEAERISARMAEAVRAHREWVEAYAKKHGGVNPLPYDPHFGVTETEYRRFIELTKQSALKKVGTVALKVSKLSDGVRFTTEGGANPLHGVEIHPAADFVATPYGALTTYSEIHASDPLSPTGRWVGSQWKKEVREGAGGERILLAIGKRMKEQDGVLYYNVTRVLPGQPQENYSLFVTYPLQ